MDESERPPELSPNPRKEESDPSASAIAQDATFYTAMRRAIEKGLEHAPIGIDRRLVRGARSLSRLAARGLKLPVVAGQRGWGRREKWRTTPSIEQPASPCLCATLAGVERTRSGNPCLSPVVKDKKRCRMHGGAGPSQTARTADLARFTYGEESVGGVARGRQPREPEVDEFASRSGRGNENGRLGSNPVHREW
jgi:hypothetical protein